MVHIVHTPSTNFNGANDAQAVAKELSMLLQNEHGKEILAPSHMLRCMMHIFQLGLKSTLAVISPSIETIRVQCSLFNHSSEV